MTVYLTDSVDSHNCWGISLSAQIEESLPTNLLHNSVHQLVQGLTRLCPLLEVTAHRDPETRRRRVLELAIDLVSTTVPYLIASPYCPSPCDGVSKLGDGESAPSASTAESST